MDSGKIGTQNSDECLPKIARYATVEQAEQSLQEQFRKNISFFQKRDGNIYQRFINYTPSQLKIIFSEEGCLNLVNCNLNNKPVYPRNPEAFSQTFVNEFCKNPIFYNIKAKYQGVFGAEKDAHTRNINPLAKLIEEHDQSAQKHPLGDFSNLFFMLGVGFGYQITQLREKTNIHHLIIVEPHQDIFFASLHTLDWEELYNSFSRENHSLKLVIGEPSRQCFDTLLAHLRKIGIHNAIKPYIFEHLSSAEMKEATNILLDRIPTIMGSMGYFDDEQLSLAHSISNYRNKVPILREHAKLKKQYLDQPAFIIGNGPSLDKAHDFLKRKHPNAIIFTCGTSAGSLLKLGIRPDFHVELERTFPLVEILSAAVDQETREKTILLGMNTIPPESYNLFRRRGMAMKDLDLGTNYLAQFIRQGHQFIRLPYTNPTVVNAGISFAMALGFKDIYLFGVDLGFSAGEQHHSNLSVHYNIKDESIDDFHLSKPNENGPSVKANFGGKILTDTIYNASRQSIEVLLHFDPEVTCYNTAEGAYIEKTRPIRYEDIDIPEETLDKETIVSLIYSNNFHLRGLNELWDDKDIYPAFEPAVNVYRGLSLLFENTPQTICEALALLDRHYQLVSELANNDKTQFAYSLIIGSVNCFNVALAKCLHAKHNEAESLALFNQGKQHYQHFLVEATHRIEHELFKVDDRFLDLKNRMKSV